MSTRLKLKHKEGVVEVYRLSLPSTPIGLAQEIIRARRYEGVACPVCGRPCQLRRRQLTAGIARHMLALYEAGGSRRFVHTPSLPHIGHDLPFAAMWALIEQQTDRQGHSRAGYWRLTELGARWLAGEVRVPRYADVFLGSVERVYGPRWSVSDALGEPFRLDDMRAG